MKWWIAPVLAFSIVPTSFAQTEKTNAVSIPISLAGPWSRVLWEKEVDSKSRPYWAHERNCQDENGSAEKSKSFGINLSADGRLTANDGTWACLLTKMEERPSTLDGRGPKWSFVATCDQFKPAESPQTSSVSKAYQPLGKAEKGEIELMYPSGRGEFRTMLRVWFDRPPTAGGLLSLFPADLYGPYVRCSAV